MLFIRIYCGSVLCEKTAMSFEEIVMICRVFLASLVAILVSPALAISQQASGPEVGSTVDEFSLQDQHGTSHKFSDLIADGPVALVVFRSADW